MESDHQFHMKERENGQAWLNLNHWMARGSGEEVKGKS
jgi:hypothetical protein